MDLSLIKSDLTIADVAAVFAQNHINKIKTELDELELKYLEVIELRTKTLNEQIRNLWQESEFAKHYHLFFESEIPHFCLQMVGDKNYRIDVDFLARQGLFYEGEYNIYFIPLDKKESNSSTMKKLGTITVKDAEGMDGTGIYKETKRLAFELTKNWKEIYTNNLTALKMNELGINAPIEIPKIPEMIINNLLSQ